MSEGREKISYEDHLKLPECIEYLQSVVAGLKSGKLTLSRGDDSLALKPASTVRVSIKAKHKTEKQSLAFAISWESEQQSFLKTHEETAPTTKSAIDSINGDTRDPMPAAGLDAKKMLEALSKEELYEKAQRLELEGRSQMCKEELVTALVSSIAPMELFTREELYERARAADVQGRSQMTKEELLKSLEQGFTQEEGVD